MIIYLLRKDITRNKIHKDIIENYQKCINHYSTMAHQYQMAIKKLDKDFKFDESYQSIIEINEPNNYQARIHVVSRNLNNKIVDANFIKKEMERGAGFYFSDEELKNLKEGKAFSIPADQLTLVRRDDLSSPPT